MPQKIRELIKELEKAGFVSRGGRGSHQNYLHAKGIVLTISGKPGDDAKPY
jgi:predicted RNA binding protein YcfA (HicA-like mRNA interferase family)